MKGFLIKSINNEIFRIMFLLESPCVYITAWILFTTVELLEIPLHLCRIIWRWTYLSSATKFAKLSFLLKILCLLFSGSNILYNKFVFQQFPDTFVPEFLFLPKRFGFYSNKCKFLSLFFFKSILSVRIDRRYVLYWNVFFSAKVTN